MPNLLQSALASDGVEMMGELGRSVTWSGTTYPAIVGEFITRVDLGEGGLTEDGEVEIRILRSAFNAGAGPFPAEGDQVTLDGRRLPVTQPNREEGSAFIILTLSTNA